MRFESIGEAMAAEMAADQADVEQAIAAADALLASSHGLDAGSVKEWWHKHRKNICKWAKRVQGFPFNIFGFIKRFGQLVQKVAQLLDKLFGIAEAGCI